MCKTILKRRLEWNDHVIQSLKEEDWKSIMCLPCNYRVITRAERNHFGQIILTPEATSVKLWYHLCDEFMTVVLAIKKLHSLHFTECKILLAKTTARWWSRKWYHSWHRCRCEREIQSLYVLLRVKVCARSILKRRTMSHTSKSRTPAFRTCLLFNKEIMVQKLRSRISLKMTIAIVPLFSH